MPEADLGDVTIHYEEAATDKPMALVFCHGLGGNGDGFVSHFDFWSQHFRCLTWDNRGLGRSSAAAKYNLPLYAGDLARLMDRLGIGRAIVLGVSWGGVVVQQFALDHPDKCAAIVLDSTSSEVNVAHPKAGMPAARPSSPARTPT
jgi:3-oxoadipate enol-lactonase